jgi:ParB-like chromosome segregation protein Spo0J
MIKMPILDVKLVNTNLIEANDYNPNHVASKEMELLELSIKEDGYTQPIVTYFDGEKYIIVDGFHRYTVGKKLKLDQLPVVVINKDINERVASTVRHNRARGTHGIEGMKNLVVMLSNNGKSDAEIAKSMGMCSDEVLRLKQSSGLKNMFSNHVFSNSWSEFEKKY